MLQVAFLLMGFVTVVLQRCLFDFTVFTTSITHYKKLSTEQPN